MATSTAVDSETGIEASALDMSLLPREVEEFYRQIVRWGMVAPVTVRDEYRRLSEAGFVHSLIADDPSLNGWAVKRNGEFRFGLHAATPVIIHFTCNQLMRTGEIFPELGDLHEDDPPIKYYTHGILRWCRFHGQQFGASKNTVKLMTLDCSRRLRLLRFGRRSSPRTTNFSFVAFRQTRLDSLLTTVLVSWPI